jgi:hypothetical protein
MLISKDLCDLEAIRSDGFELGFGAYDGICLDGVELGLGE